MGMSISKFVNNTQYGQFLNEVDQSNSNEEQEQGQEQGQEQVDNSAVSDNEVSNDHEENSLFNDIFSSLEEYLLLPINGVSSIAANIKEYLTSIFTFENGDDDITSRSRITNEELLRKIFELDPTNNNIILCQPNSDPSNSLPQAVYKFNIKEGWLNCFDAVEPQSRGAWQFECFCYPGPDPEQDDTIFSIMFNKDVTYEYSNMCIRFNYINSSELHKKGCRYVAECETLNGIIQYQCIPESQEKYNIKYSVNNKNSSNLERYQLLF